MEETLKISLSKKLSYLLRHDPDIKRDNGGWVATKDIKDKRLLQHLREITLTSEKNRFELDADNKRIRARQGHSVKNIKENELLLAQTVDAEGNMNGYTHAVHSTFLSAIPEIRASGGLSKMKRNHVHMVLAKIEDIRSLNAQGNIPGMRKNANAFVAINLQKASTAGCNFFLSGNSVLLSAGNANGCIPWDCCTLYY